jgi:hypothetical protein
LFRNSLFRLFRFSTETESFDISIEPKQTENHPEQFGRVHIVVFLGVPYGMRYTLSLSCTLNQKNRNARHAISKFHPESEESECQTGYQLVAHRIRRIGMPCTLSVSCTPNQKNRNARHAISKLHPESEESEPDTLTESCIPKKKNQNAIHSTCKLHPESECRTLCLKVASRIRRIGMPYTLYVSCTPN